MARKAIGRWTTGTILILLVFAPRGVRATDVPRWSTYDISLHAAGSYANPYAAGPSLAATFTGPGGETKTVTGFWDGDSTYKIRFTPTAEGAWSYTTRSSDAGLNSKSGTITATAAANGRHGFLRVDPKHRYSFVWDDGTRYFMMGQTYYDWMQAVMVNDNWKTAIDSMPAYGFSKVRFDVYACNTPPEPNTYPDAQPYTGDSANPDRDSLNLPYWRKLDELVRYMDSRGLVADLILTTPYRGNRQFGTALQNDRFIKYVVARYAAYPNVIWCVCNEYSISAWTKKAIDPRTRQRREDFDRMGKLVRGMDPWMRGTGALRPLSIHPEAGDTFNFAGASWPTHVILQHVVGTPPPDETVNRGILKNLRYNMPVVNDEFKYVGQLQREPHRQALWAIATAGGYSSTADFRNHPNGNGIPESTGDWTYQPEYDDIKRMVDFFATKGVEYWKMTSRNDLKAGSRSRDYVLAEPGRQYVLYTAVGGSVQLNLAGYNSTTFNVWKYDPVSGAMTRLGTTPGGAWRTFDLSGANSGGDFDWALLVTTAPKPSTSGAAPIFVMSRGRRTHDRIINRIFRRAP